VRGDGGLRFDDPEGLGLELELFIGADAPLVAEHPDIPQELALQGFGGVRMYSSDTERGRELLEQTLGFEPSGDSRWELQGEHRGAFYERLPAPDEQGIPGAGTVHHVAWASSIEEHEDWQRKVAADGYHPTPVIDRFEIATLGPGFATDEPIEHLGERLSLPPDFEHLRDQLDGVLTPLPDARAGRV
jgi:glyoxalase family protein